MTRTLASGLVALVVGVVAFLAMFTDTFSGATTVARIDATRDVALRKEQRIENVGVANAQHRHPPRPVVQPAPTGPTAEQLRLVELEKQQAANAARDAERLRLEAEHRQERQRDQDRADAERRHRELLAAQRRAELVQPVVQQVPQVPPTASSATTGQWRTTSLHRPVPAEAFAKPPKTMPVGRLTLTVYGSDVEITKIQITEAAAATCATRTIWAEPTTHRVPGAKVSYHAVCIEQVARTAQWFNDSWRVSVT